MPKVVLTDTELECLIFCTKITGEMFNKVKEVIKYQPEIFKEEIGFNEVDISKSELKYYTAKVALERVLEREI